VSSTAGEATFAHPDDQDAGRRKGGLAALVPRVKDATPARRSHMAVLLRLSQRNKTHTTSEKSSVGVGTTSAGCTRVCRCRGACPPHKTPLVRVGSQTGRRSAAVDAAIWSARQMYREPGQRGAPRHGRLQRVSL